MTAPAQLALLAVFESGVTMISKTAPRLHVTALDGSDLDALQEGNIEIFRHCQALARCITEEKARRSRQARDDAERFGPLTPKTMNPPVPIPLPILNPRRENPHREHTPHILHGHSVAMAAAQLIDLLPKLDPEALSPEQRQGYTHTLTDLHNAIHLAKQRPASSPL